MTSVPNWIPRAVVYVPRETADDVSVVHPIKSWRATATQVVVTFGNNQEARFRLADLSSIGDPFGSGRAFLVEPSEPRVRRALAWRKVADLRLAMLDDLNGVPLGPALAGRILTIRDAAQDAIDALGEWV